MTTVQLAIRDLGYAQLLQRLLAAGKEFKVLMVDRPDASLPGLIVVGQDGLEDWLAADPDRLVVIAGSGSARELNELWKAGFRNVVFADQSPEVAYLAIVGAHLKYVASGARQKYSILDREGVKGLEENGLQGPFALIDNVIDDAVRLKSPGVFVLDDRDDAATFRIEFVGRSDIDVNNQLHVYVGAYRRFKFIYSSSPRAAFEKQCSIFHDFEPSDNVIHPQRPLGSRWTCPHCKLLG